MSELNPNHPVTQEMHDNWHKIVALIMRKFGVSEVEIGLEDISGEGMAVVADTRKNDVLIIRLITMKEAEKLAKEVGGLLV